MTGGLLGEDTEGAGAARAECPFADRVAGGGRDVAGSAAVRVTGGLPGISSVGRDLPPSEPLGSLSGKQVDGDRFAGRRLRDSRFVRGSELDVMEVRELHCVI
jgi:hypothetical protein